MRHTRLVSLVAVTALMSFAASAAAAVSGAAPPKGQTPLLITNAGQGPGAKMARLLLQRTGAVSDFDYNAEPQPADLAAKPYKTLMVVLGSTAKGLGASGITIDDEIARLNAMMAEAKKLKLQIVCVLLEGKTRRGKPGGAGTFHNGLFNLEQKADRLLQMPLANELDVIHQRAHEAAREEAGIFDRNAFGERIALAGHVSALDDIVHAREKFGLNAHDLDAGLERAGNGRDARDQPAAANRDGKAINVRRVFQHFERKRALTR
ncbi:MAG TPA: DUF6305 family protein, partial [Vicinamibacterales bacterium]|nr:DUF6305 family protein [Vicinamibacterales bacterium]